MGRPGRLALRAVACAGAVAIGAAGSASVADEVIGKVSQPLVAGAEVSPQEQQDQGLVGIGTPDGTCSGVLLNSEWVISAAHCFTAGTKSYQVSITADWSKQQTREGIELHLLDNDIALVRISAPLEGVGPDFNMPVFTGTIAPGRSIRTYGAGIYALATGKGASAQPSMSDDKFRSGDFQVGHVDDARFWFGPGKGGTIPAGGDSGGPAFINAGGQNYLAGISSQCMAFVVSGKPKVTDDWTWVNRVTECGYAHIAPAWPQILQHIGSVGCRKYAWRAVGAVEYAKDHGCDPAVISGPRWSPYFDEHLRYCMGAKAADANAEDKARGTIMNECRVAAAMPKGIGALAVEETAEGFTLSGAGYPVNSRVIIRVFGPAAVEQNISSNFSNANGVFFAKLGMAKVCAAAGTITFTAEDQDRPASPPVNATCKQVQAATGDAAAAPMEPAPAPAAPAPMKKLQKLQLKKPVTVKLDVDLYDAPGGAGQVIGMLGAGTQNVTLLAPCSGGWCHLNWPAGEGWVYNGPDYQSLMLP